MNNSQPDSWCRSSADADFQKGSRSRPPASIQCVGDRRTVLRIITQGVFACSMALTALSSSSTARCRESLRQRGGATMASASSLPVHGPTPGCSISRRDLYDHFGAEPHIHKRDQPPNQGSASGAGPSSAATPGYWRTGVAHRAMTGSADEAFDGAGRSKVPAPERNSKWSDTRSSA